MHAQDRLQWFSNATSFKFLVFVIWKTITIYVELEKKSIRKDRVVIDICELNVISVIDLYSLSLQENVIIKL